MVTNTFDWTIENNKDFQKKIDELGKATNDFRIPFRLISSDFYRSQKQLFSLKGAGLFTDLSPRYKKTKQRSVGFVYPILVGKTDNLSVSTLTNSHPYSIFRIDKKSLELGSSVPYGKYHQSDKPRNKIPQRKFVFITGGKGDMSKDSGINGRRERWLFILDTHIKQLITGEI